MKIKQRKWLDAKELKSTSKNMFYLILITQELIYPWSFYNKDKRPKKVFVVFLNITQLDSSDLN